MEPTNWMLRARRLALSIATCIAASMSPAVAAVAADLEKPRPRSDSIAELAENLSRESRMKAVLSVGPSNGLPSSSVQALATTPDGYLWVGTTGGLCRFDGSTIQRFRATDTEGIGDDRILALHAGSDGVLWIGTSVGGLSRLRDGVFEIIIPSDEIRNVASITEIDGRIWAVGERAYVVEDGRPRQVSLGVHASREKWPGASGVYGFDGGVALTGAFGILHIVDGESELLTDKFTRALFKDSGGEYWAVFGGRSSIAPLRDLSRVRSAPRLTTVYDQMQISDNEVVLAGEHGLQIARGHGEELELFALEGEARPFVFHPFGERDYWVGMQRKGLVSLSPAHFEMVDLPTRDNRRPPVLVIASGDDGQTVVGSLEGAESWIVQDGRGHPIDDGASPIANRLFSVAALDGGGFLAVDELGLLGIDGSQVRRVRTYGGAQVRARIFPGRGGVAWFWINGQLECIDRLGETLAVVPGVDDIPDHGYPVDDGLLFLSGDSITHLKFSEGFPFDPAWAERELAAPVLVARIPNTRLRSCMLDERGDLWVTTYGQGLLRRTPGGRIDRWTSSEGLLDDYLGAVATARDRDGIPRLWLNSNSGAFAVTFESLDAVLASPDARLVSRLVASPEGNGRTGGKISASTLLLPTIDGLAMVEASGVRLEREPPRLVVEDVLLSGEPYRDGQEIESGSSLEIRYGGIDFPDSRAVVFEYRLEGYDDQWVEAGSHRVARYARIPPGKYRFQLRSRTKGGVWSEALSVPATGVFNVQPHWYEVTAVRVLGVLGLFLAGVGLIQLRTRVLRRRSRWLSEEIQRRKDAEEELKRSRTEHVDVLDAAHDGILSVDRHWTVMIANQAMAELLGRCHGDLSGAGMDQIGLGELRSRIAAALRGPEPGSWTTPSLSTLELEVERADGTSVDVEATFTWDGTTSKATTTAERLTIVVRDVSDKRAMVEGLRQGEQRFRTLFRMIPTAVFAWRPSLQLVDWNDAAESLFGFSDDAQSPPILLDLFPATARIDRFRLAIESVLSGSLQDSIVHSARLGTGEDRLFRWSFAPLLLDDGSIHSVVTLATDITEDSQDSSDLDVLRRRVVRAEESERAMIARELHDNLTQRLAALTLELDVETPQVSSEPDTQASEIRRPESSEAMTRVRERIEEVAHDAHALSRQLHPTALEDLGLTGALRSECERQADRHGIVIEFFDQSDGYAPDREVSLAVFRVAQEALRNAAKHGDPTEVHVHLERAPFHSIRLTVKDDGEGFDVGRADGATSTGLGLANMRERARLIGAELSLSSRKGEGTTVTLVAPLGGDDGLNAAPLTLDPSVGESPLVR